jgi:hypothetical protein
MAIDSSQIMQMLMMGGPSQAPQMPVPSSPMGVGNQGMPLDPNSIPPDVLLALLQEMSQWRGGGQGPQMPSVPGMTPPSPVGTSPSPQSLPPELLQMLMMGGPPGSGQPSGPMMGPSGPMPSPSMGPPPGMMNGPMPQMPPGPPPNMSGPGPSAPSGPPPSPPTPPAPQGPTPAQAVAEQKANDYEKLLPMLAGQQSSLLQALFTGIGNDRQGALQSIRQLSPASVDSWLKNIQQIIGNRLGQQQGPPPNGPGPSRPPQ